MQRSLPLIVAISATSLMACGPSSANHQNADRAARVASPEITRHGKCPEGMASVEDRYCIDKYEGSLVEILPGGEERTHSPFQPIGGATVRAVSLRGVHPQGYVSALEAKAACGRSGKRLCRATEWKEACMGPAKLTWSYGKKREPRRCNDSGRNPVVAAFGPNAFTWKRMNDSVLNQLENTLAKSGEHEGCESGYGVSDMVGNLHEWVDDAAGTFYGGYYQDVTQNGPGCGYKTTAHEAAYHDYSTGFRCCADSK